MRVLVTLYELMESNLGAAATLRNKLESAGFRMAAVPELSGDSLEKVVGSIQHPCRWWPDAPHHALVFEQD